MQLLLLAEFTAIYLNITLHAQIQHTEIYSLLYPPVSESVTFCAGAAIIALTDERRYEMNRVFN